MSFLQDLRAEIDTDPLSRGYAAMQNDAIAADLNTAYRTANVTSLTGDQLFTSTDGAEFAALTDHKRELWVSWTSKVSVDPWDAANVAFVTWIFGAGAGTLSNLNALRTKNISRATELGWGAINESNVYGARAL